MTAKTQNIKKMALISAFMITTALFACGDSNSESANDSPAIKNNPTSSNSFQHRIVSEALESEIKPYFAEAKTASSELVNNIRQLCVQPNDKHLADAKTAWQNAMLAWAKTEIITIKPVVSDTRNRHYIYFFPDDKQLTPKNVNILLTENTQTIDVDFLKINGAAESGLSGLEYVLFGELSNNAKVPKPVDFTGKRCELAQAQSQLLVSDITAYDALWQGQYGQDFVNHTGEFAGDAVSINAWFNNILALAETMKNQKLGFATGYTTGTPKSVFDARYAGISVLIYRANFNTLKNALLGGLNMTGIAIYLDSNIADKLTNDTLAVQSALNAIPEQSFANADKAKAKKLFDAMNVLVSTIKNDVSKAANLQVTFNGNDGD